MASTKNGDRARMGEFAAAVPSAVKAMKRVLGRLDLAALAAWERADMEAILPLAQARAAERRTASRRVS